MPRASNGASKRGRLLKAASQRLEVASAKLGRQAGRRCSLFSPRCAADATTQTGDLTAIQSGCFTQYQRRQNTPWARQSRAGASQTYTGDQGGP